MKVGLFCLLLTRITLGLKYLQTFKIRLYLCTVAAVEISDRKDSNTLYKFRNLISVNRIFIKDYKVSVSI
jgi:hypothetical protein